MSTDSEGGASQVTASGQIVSEAAIDAELQIIWARFRGQMMERVESIESALVALVEGRLDSELRAGALRDAHRLVGSAGTFGRHEASNIAREIEQLFAGQESMGDAEISRALELTEMLRGSLLKAPATSETGQVDAALIAIVHRDADFRAALGLVCGERGYSWVIAKRFKSLFKKLDGRVPTVLLFELETGGKALAKLKGAIRVLGSSCAVYGVSDNEKLSFRVRSMNQGVRSFLSTSLSAEEMIAYVTETLGKAPQVRQRILAIDDDPVIAATLRLMLDASGFEVVVVSDPERFWREFKDNEPDLVLLDLDIPGIGGDELCRLIRADARYRTLPVIFLSAADAHVTTELVFNAGADDYVEKPIVRAELVSRIASHLERARVFQVSNELDVSTGLPNRRKFEDGWSRLTEKAMRENLQFSYVLIEIDDLAGVNERFGRDFGDLVLRELGQSLTRQFRGEHLTARWTAGQIVLALYGVGGQDAVEQVSRALEVFSSVTIATPDGARLHVTCSATIGELHRDGDDLGELYRRADETLGVVQKLGSDQVVRVVERSLDAAIQVTEEIVIVEDDDAVGELLLHGLSARGYHCRRITDGQFAVDELTKAGQFRPALVLLDVDLPGLDGFTVLERLRRAGVLKTTKVIVLTARSSETEVVRALELGAFDHVTKPFSLPILLQRVRQAIGQ